jgi:hypothetical protein
MRNMTLGCVALFVALGTDAACAKTLEERLASLERATVA